MPLRAPKAMPIQNAPFLALTISVFLNAIIVSSQSSDAREYLEAHNVFRKKMNVGPLQWDEKLATYASAWASQRIDDCDHYHHSQGPYGENIFWELYDEKDPKQVVEIWFDEQKNYDHQKLACKCQEEDDNCMCGHYTQVIWYSTQRVGCANVTCNNNMGTYIVCSYDPPGNYPNKNPLGNPSNGQSQTSTPQGGSTQSVVQPPPPSKSPPPPPPRSVPSPMATNTLSMPSPTSGGSSDKVPLGQSTSPPMNKNNPPISSSTPSPTIERSPNIDPSGLPIPPPTNKQILHMKHHGHHRHPHRSAKVST